MMKDKIIVTSSRYRPLFYTLSITAGMVILLTLHDLAVNPIFFWAFSGALYLVIAIEVVSTYKYALKRAERLELPHLAYLAIKPHFYYHLFITSTLYFSSVVFIYLQFNTVVEIISIAIASSTYYVVLRHLQATIMRDFKTEIWSEHIVDSSVIVIFFYCMSAINELSARFSINYLLSSIFVTVISWIFLSASTWKKSRWTIVALLYISIIALIFGAIAYTTISTLYGATSITRATLLTVGYYLLSAIYYHLLDGTLNWGIVAEYILIAAVAVFLYLSAI